MNIMMNRRGDFMNQENQDKLFKALGDIKDVAVNVAFDKTIRLSDKVSKDRRYSESKRQQAREYGDELRARKRDFNLSEEYDYDEGDECNEYESEIVEPCLSQNAHDIKPANGRSTNSIKENKRKDYQWYLKALRNRFGRKEGWICADIEDKIYDFIIEYRLDGEFGITISDVVEDLHFNSIEGIFEAHDRYIELLKQCFRNDANKYWLDEDIDEIIYKNRLFRYADKTVIKADLYEYSIIKLDSPKEREYINLLKNCFGNNKKRNWTDSDIARVIYKKGLMIYGNLDTIKKDLVKYSIIQFK